MDKNKSLPSIPQHAISGRPRDLLALRPKINTRNSPNTLTLTARNAELKRDKQGKPLGREENGARPHNPPPSMNEFNAIQNYVIPIKRTPSHLTPSQRLQLRRDQMSNSIANYRLPGDDRVRSNHRARNLEFSSNDLDIDAEDDICNVPFVPNHEYTEQRYLDDLNETNRYSLNTNSTRSSSIWSHNSVPGRNSSISLDTEYDHDPNAEAYLRMKYSRTSEIDDISFRLDKNEAAYEYENARQRYRLLTRSLEVIPTHSLQSVPESGNISNKYCLDNSKSLSNVLTYTRPTWLPPKSPQDRTKHHKEASKILKNAMKQVSIEQQKRQNEMKYHSEQKEKDIDRWHSLVAEDALSQVHYDPHLRDMYWRGIPSSVRATAWTELLSSPSRLNTGDSRWYLNQVNLIFCNSDQVTASGNYEVPPNIKQFDRKLIHEMRSQFGNQLTSEQLTGLRKVMWGVIFFMNERYQLLPITRATAKNIRTDYFFLGLLDLTYIVWRNSADVSSTFVKICNLFLSPALADMIAYIGETNEYQRRKIFERTYGDLVDKFDLLFDETVPNLKLHFDTIGLHTKDYLHVLILSFLTQTLSYDSCAQIIDIYIIEGVDALLSIIIATLRVLSPKLFGALPEVQNLLGVSVSANDERSILRSSMRTDMSIEIFSLAKKLAQTNRH